MKTKQGARNFAGRFYKSKKWESLSLMYRTEHPFCERCLKLYEEGKIACPNPSEIVHHKIHIDAENYTDPDILFGTDNLEALCRKCHAEEHSSYKADSYDEEGRLII